MEQSHSLLRFYTHLSSMIHAVLENIIKNYLGLSCLMVSECNLLQVVLYLFQLKVLMEQFCRASTTKAVGFNGNDEVDQ